MHRALPIALLLVACGHDAPLAPCQGQSCPRPPAPFCDGDTLVVTAPGTCALDGEPHCVYDEQRTDCAASGGTCDGGACVAPCAGVTCDRPPPARCDAGVLTAFAASGRCRDSGSGPVCEYVPTTTDCGARDELCDAAHAACAAACVPDPCTSPPASGCSGDVATTYASPGVCKVADDKIACTYDATTTDCAASGLLCKVGACATAFPIAMCKLEDPNDITDLAGTSYPIRGRVYAQGLTDRTGADDLDPHVVAELGVGSGADPSSWTWTAAAPDLAYGPGAADYAPTLDQYVATFTLPATPGAITSFAYRFSADAGHTWMYCDRGAGSLDGFHDPGVLTVVAPYLSQYVDGLAQADAVEIFNPGATAFPLDGCAIDVYTDGATSAAPSIPLTGAAIAPGGVYTLCSKGYNRDDKAACDQRDPPSLWDGNDAVVLRCGDTILDVLGQIGVDPGVAWGMGTITTQHHTLIRRCDVLAGDADGGDPFDPAAQWAGYPLDDAYLGARRCPLP